MKKIILLFTCTITFIPYLFGMELIPLKPKCHTHDALKLAFIDHLCRNVHKYVNHDYNSSTEASKIIVKVSRINIDLYNTLHNDPTVARDVITNVRQYCYPEIKGCIPYLNNFRFPGVQQCRKLSEQLYDDNLTEDKLEELFNKGAVISFNPTYVEQSHNKRCPIVYWYHTKFKETENQSKKIINKLLSLGANPDGVAFTSGILDSSIYSDNIDIVNMILPYKPTIGWEAWFHASEKNSQGDQKYIDLLLSHATPDEINAALRYNIESNNKNPDLMQKFIDHGANPNIALHHLMSRHHKDVIYSNGPFTQIFNLLCNNKAFDKDGFIMLRRMQKSINSLLSTLEENQPANIEELEQQNIDLINLYEKI